MYDRVQRFARTKMVLPLRVWLDDRPSEASPTQLAHTIDTSDIGCRLGGLRTKLSPGQIITLQRGQHKAAFRVIWSKQLEPHENQAGVEVLEHNLDIWSANSQPNPEGTPVTDPPSSVELALSAILSDTPAPFRPKRKLTLALGGRRLRWCLGTGLLSLGMATGLYLYFQLQLGSRSMVVEPWVLAPPTARDLAQLMPKHHTTPASLISPLDSSVARLKVAEAPSGRVVYPVAPDDGITGKVQLQIVIAANGVVKQIHVLSGKQQLAEAAARAVRLWHYPSLPGMGPFRERETNVTVSFLGTDAVSLRFPHNSSDKDN